MHLLVGAAWTVLPPPPLDRCSPSSLSFSHDEMSTLVCIVRHVSLTLIDPMKISSHDNLAMRVSPPNASSMHHLLSGHSPDARDAPLALVTPPQTFVPLDLTRI